METSEIFRAGGSMRRSLRSTSSSIWRNRDMEVFSKSSRDEDDEEALRWAALERLPTYARLRKGILTTSQGQPSEIDVDNLGLKERRELIERLINVADEDNEKFLLKLRNRIDRVGIELPTIEVRYEHLHVEAETYVGSRALPTFINFISGIVEIFVGFLPIFKSKKQKLTILKDVSGVIKPGRMTLLLGPPSSGKTTLLLALAGKLDSELKTSGRVTYNGHDMNEFVPRRTAAYISQYDVHIGEMTVRETFAFSARCQGVGSRYDMLAELSRREKEANIKPDPDIDVYMKAMATEGQETNVVTDYVIKILGLEVCADIMVGDEMLRGISGGQRKRVTTGEMLVGPAGVLLMDEISTGLDSSTTYQIVNSLKHYVHIFNGTTVISLLQPAPETYDLFDDIILLSDSQVVYQGPREYVLDFFEYMGFRCPERKGVADFLQEVTSKKDQAQYWLRKEKPYRFVTVKEFAEAFQSFHVGQRLGDELAIEFDKSKNHRAALTTKEYGMSAKELVKACFSREYLLMKRNSFVYIFKIVQICVMALVCTTVFLRTKMKHNTVNDGFIYLGALFFAMITIMFTGMVEISLAIAKLPVFYKQRDLHFFPAWAYSVPATLLRIPFLFRAIAVTARNMVIANTFGSFVLLLLFALGGFVLSREDIKSWWLWGYWSSPLMYGQVAILINEFLGNKWRHFTANSTESLGVQVLKARGFFAESKWYWIGIGALLGFIVVFNLLYTVALTFLNGKSFDKVRAARSDSSDEDGNAKRAVEMRRRGSNTSHQTQAGETNNKRGMILPFEPHSIVFDDIVYAVDMPQEMKSQGVVEDKLVLLKAVSGSFRPGVLTALMGVSGAGKTTLMDVLAGRKTGGYIEGDIRISGYPKKQETFARISGYCEQNDIHSPYVTVYESLLYSAWLRLSAEVNVGTRKMFIEEVMELVELTSLRQALVGLPGVNGLSTEQRKRLTIAVELVANPSIIFMDEPTSGLDARAAAIVMRTVRNTVDTGRTVVCTIHQPSIDIFEAFDELLLLKRGGQDIYVGPLGRHSSHLINYFESIEGVPKIKDGYNPATWMLEVSSPAQELALGVDFADLYRNSELYRRNKDLIKALSTPTPGSQDLYFPTQYSRSFVTQCMACLWKQRLSYWRNPPYTAVRFLFTTFIAILFGTVFWNMGSKTSKQQDVNNAMGSMYSAVFFIGVQNAMSVQPVVSVERTVFYRERAAGMYAALPYTFGQVIVEIPYLLCQAVVYCIIVYAMIGFHWTVVKFSWYLFFTFFSMMYFTYYGMMNVGLSPNYHISQITSAAFYSLWNLFSGFIIPRTRIPIWWRWYYWACPVAWTLYGLIVSQYGDINDVINHETGQTVKQFAEDYYGFKHSFLGVVAVVNVSFGLLFAFVFALAIKSFNFQRR
ncbi:hypothetical protein TIFTF001_006704 [Ficus carica]|uniref:ABC transporter domain-containing protein n=1 Tax=Ficus carica TaxID=3494 RepID=A0AA87ZPX5_FICCA|nr:hypothetical protein TIFTF001_006704 [Ficus carica]